MPQHHEQRTLPYTPQQMFDLVLDVKSYPQFLPWCQATRVYNEQPGQFDADVLIGYKMLREKYSCTVQHQAPHTINVLYRSGPFKQLTNQWQFHPAPEGCTIEFFIEFEFRSRLLQKIASSLFHEVVRRMVSSFEARAATLYAPYG